MSKNNRKNWGLGAFATRPLSLVCSTRGKILTRSSSFVVKLLVICLIVLGILQSPEVATAGRSIIVGKVVKVLDGDSLMVDDGKRRHEVRLWGIDSPEYKQPYGNRSRKLATQLARNKRVKIYSHGKDQYHRVLGEVYINSLCLNEEMVTKGAAWVYRRYCRKSVCNEWLKAEEKARSAKLGLWRDKKPIPPWEWRRK